MDYDVYGLRVRANRSLPHLVEASHEGNGAEPVVFDLEKEPPADGERLLRVSYTSDVGGLHFAVHPEGTHVWARWSEGTRAKLTNDATGLLVGPILAGLLRIRGVLSLHASVVEIDQRAVLMLGAPGAGKSTIAAALAQEGHGILSDDVAAVTERADGTWMTRAGYPRLRLGPEAVATAAVRPRDAGPVITGSDKRYVALSEAPHAATWRFQSQSLPIAAIVELRADTTTTAPVIQRVGGARRVALLLEHTRSALGRLDPGIWARELESLTRLSLSVPLRRLSYPPGLANIPAMCATLVDEARSNSM